MTANVCHFEKHFVQGGNPAQTCTTAHVCDPHSDHQHSQDKSTVIWFEEFQKVGKWVILVLYCIL